MGNLGLTIKLWLKSEEFKRGMRETIRSFERMQYKVIALAGAFTGIGVSVGGFINRLREVARETNRVNVTLQNVSRSGIEFTNSLKYLHNLSTTYKQDLNILTESFAKFKASCDNAGVTTAAQEKIFSSFTKTIAAFNLPASNANLAMLALQQMMSKGKVSAEELRRQLGENIPIAMAAMANAAGVPMSKLDDLLKAGKLMSAEVMPRFAEELDKMTGSINLDNIETALNEQKNALIKFSEWLGTKDIYKGIVEGVTWVINYIREHVISAITSIAGLLSGLQISRYFGKGLSAFNKQLEATKEKAAQLSEAIKVKEQQIATFDARPSSKVAKADDALKAHIAAHESIGREITAKSAEVEERLTQIKSAGLDRRLELARISIEKEKTVLNQLMRARADIEEGTATKGTLKKYEGVDLNRRIANQRLVIDTAQAERDLLKLEEAQVKSAERVAKSRDLFAQANHERAIQRQKLEAEARMMRTEQQAAKATVSGTTVWAKFKAAGQYTLASLRAGFTALGATIKAALSATIFMAIFTLIGDIIGKVIEWGKAQLEARNAVKNTREEIEKAGNALDDEGRKLQSLQTRLEEGTRLRKDTLSIENEINSILGTQLSGHEALNDAIQRRLNLKRTELRLQKALAIESEAIEKLRSNIKSPEALRNFDENISKKGFVEALLAVKTWRSSSIEKWAKDNHYDKAFGYRFKDVANELSIRSLFDNGSETALKKVVEARAQINNALSIQEKQTNEYADKLLNIEKIKSAADKKAREEELRRQQEIVRKNGLENTVKGRSVLQLAEDLNRAAVEENAQAKAGQAKAQKSDIQRARERYTERLNELNNQLANAVLTEKQYNEEVNKVHGEYLRAAGGLLTSLQAQHDPLFAKAKRLYKAELEESEWDKHYENYKKVLSDLQAKRKAGIITEKEYGDATFHALQSLVNFIVTLKEIPAEVKALSSELLSTYLEAKEERRGAKPTKAERDTFFDYKKNELDKTREEVTNLKDWVEALEQWGATAEEIAKAKEVLEEWQQKEKELTKESDIQAYRQKVEEAYGAIYSTIATGLRRATSAFKNFWSVINNDEASATSKLIATLNVTFTLIDAALKLSSAYEKAARSKKALAAAGGIMGSASPIGIIGTIIGTVGSFFGAGHFANGGLVEYGTTVGDRTHAFVNKGERILTRGNQDWLETIGQRLREEGNFGRNIQVSGRFELENSKLVASVKKENRRWDRS